MTPPIAPSQPCQAIVFNAAGFRFALPFNAVDRIVHRSLLQADGAMADLLYFERQPLETVDLAQLLHQQSEHSNRPQFFLVTEVGRRLGIATDGPPVMLNLPLEAVHPLPANYHRTLRGLARQMVTLGEEHSTPQSLLLLELPTLAQLTSQQSNQLPTTAAIA